MASSLSLSPPSFSTPQHSLSRSPIPHRNTITLRFHLHRPPPSPRQASKRVSNFTRESSSSVDDHRKWSRNRSGVVVGEYDDDGDEDEDDDDEDEEDRSLDLLVRFVQNVFKKISRKARKAVRSVLPINISAKLLQLEKTRPQQCVATRMSTLGACQFNWELLRSNLGSGKSFCGQRQESRDLLWLYCHLDAKVVLLLVSFSHYANCLNGHAVGNAKVVVIFRISVSVFYVLSLVNVLWAILQAGALELEGIPVGFNPLIGSIISHIRIPNASLVTRTEIKESNKQNNSIAYMDLIPKSLHLVGFSVDGVVILAFLWILKAFIEVICTLGTVVFVSILLVRGIWAGISYLQETQNNRTNELDDDRRVWSRAQPVT
ncbi:hypothetical protein LguiA_027305 [Lonicera macranthoides]